MMTLWQYCYSLRDNNDIIDDSVITLTNVKEELLALTTSLEYRYSPFCNNDDSSGYISNIKANNDHRKPYNSHFENYFNGLTDDGVQSF